MTNFMKLIKYRIEQNLLKKLAKENRIQVAKMELRANSFTDKQKSVYFELKEQERKLLVMMYQDSVQSCNDKVTQKGKK